MTVYESKFSNGDQLIDKVTGFKGTVMSVAFYSTGCIHYALAPKIVKDNKIESWEWLDESRLEKSKGKKIVFNISTDKKSGPMPNGPTI